MKLSTLAGLVKLQMTKEICREYSNIVVVLTGLLLEIPGSFSKLNQSINQNATSRKTHHRHRQ